MPRWLLSHPESECIFEVHSRFALQQCVDQGCDDVTGLKEFETRFQLEKSKEIDMPPTRRKISKEQEEREQPAGDALHLKYRPQMLSELVGHDGVRESLDNVINSRNPAHAFLFTGDKGVGKTTLARILAREFECVDESVIEIDAAVTNSVDDMRKLTEEMNFMGLTSTNKMYIIDECHLLSKQAWGALLKAVEEPPKHVYFCFCTTEAGKVPDTIESRCVSYTLKPLRYSEIMALLSYVVNEELIDIPVTIVQMVAEKAAGSARMALTMLQKVIGVHSDKKAQELLEAPDAEAPEIIDLCRMIMSSKTTWADIQKTINALKETTTPESVRIVMVNYIAGALLRERGEDAIPYLLDMLTQFSKPCNPSDKWAPILLAIGNVMFPGG